MRIYKIADYAQESKKNFLDMFGDNLKTEAKPETTSAPQQKEITLTLYRGFNYLPQPNSDGTYTLSPQNSEQKVLWFTHAYANCSDPIEYAQSHGNYLLTFPLKVIKHYQTVSYDDKSYNIIPENILNLSSPAENCRYHMGLELPEGWLFSYKMQKFIVSTVPITVTKDMITS